MDKKGVIKKRYGRLLNVIDHNFNPLNLLARVSGKRENLKYFKFYEMRIWKPIRKLL